VLCTTTTTTTTVATTTNKLRQRCILHDCNGVLIPCNQIGL